MGCSSSKGRYRGHEGVAVVGPSHAEGAGGEHHTPQSLLRSRHQDIEVGGDVVFEDFPWLRAGWAGDGSHVNYGFGSPEDVVDCRGVLESARHELRREVVGLNLVCGQDVPALVHQQLNHPAPQPSRRSGYYYHRFLRLIPALDNTPCSPNAACRILTGGRGRGYHGSPLPGATAQPSRSAGSG